MANAATTFNTAAWSPNVLCGSDWAVEITKPNGNSNVTRVAPSGLVADVSHLEPVLHLTLWLPLDQAGEAAEGVLALLREGLHLQARDAALRAAQQFPGDSRIGRLAGALDPRSKARVNPSAPRQPDRTKDFAWLRNPPAWARGKWVALAGGVVVASGDTLAAVQRVLHNAKRSGPLLVHRVD